MNSWIPLRAICLCLAVPGVAAGQPALPPDGSDWGRVDALEAGTRVAVTLETGEPRVGRFRGSTIDGVVVDLAEKGGDVRQETLKKSTVRRVVIEDPVRDGIGWGALLGGGGVLALLQATTSACGIGCENDLPGAMPLLAGAIGAGIGSVVGLLADRLSDRSEVLFPPSEASARTSRGRANRFFPSRPSLRIGSFYGQASFRSAAIEGSAVAPGFALAGDVAPYVSLHAEFHAIDATFFPSTGSIPDSVLSSVVPATSRVAGRSYGIESRRVSLAFSELVGVHPPPIGRVRLEFLAGVGTRRQEDRDYYDAYRDVGRGTLADPSRVERLPGKYYILNFESSQTGIIYGLDAEVATVGGLLVVPTIRYTRTANPGPSIAYGVGAHWRF